MRACSLRTTFLCSCKFGCRFEAPRQCRPRSRSDLLPTDSAAKGAWP
jgi:hypothetical protein